MCSSGNDRLLTNEKMTYEHIQIKTGKIKLSGI